MNEPTDHDALGRTAARILLDTGAVLFRPDRPFFFSSGWASPVYVDCKKAISFPLARDALIDLSVKRILSVVGYASMEGVAGAEGGGIPFAAIIADRLHLPLVIARKQAAGIGPESQTSGVVQPDRKLLLVDDLTTDGRTKANMSAALRRAGARVDHAFVIFRYGIYDSAVSEDALGIRLSSLLTWRELLAVAREEQAFANDTLDEIEAYISDPLVWSARHGGLSEAEFNRASAR